MKPADAGQTAHIAKVGKGAILIYTEGADRAGARIPPVEKFAIELMAMSRFVLPAGLVPTTVPATGVSALVPLIAKPEIVEVPAFEV
ncbi:MAG TPA: hypothetical protein VEV41_12145 [Terriglobales bacterium]|nr:hypothetical protein [Terriglobales bacterium]